MGSEARRSKVFSWQRSAHARDLVLKMKRDYFRELRNLRATGLILKYVVTCNVYYVKSDAMLEMFMRLIRYCQRP